MANSLRQRLGIPDSWTCSETPLKMSFEFALWQDVIVCLKKDKPKTKQNKTKLNKNPKQQQQTPKTKPTMLNCWFCSVSKTQQSHCLRESSAGVTQKFFS